MKAAALLVISLWLTGCGNDDTDACAELGAATCDRAAECGLLAPDRVEWCVDEYRRDCAAGPVPGDDQVDACVEALAAFDCDELAAGGSPPECEP